MRALTLDDARIRPDGLYFAPLLPIINGAGAVLKIRYEPDNAHAPTIADLQSVDLASANEVAILRFMAAKGCFGCHQAQDKPTWRGGSKGPVLASNAMIEQIEQRISSQAHLKYLRELDAQDDELLNRYTAARHEVAEAQERARARLDEVPDHGASLRRFAVRDASAGLERG